MKKLALSFSLLCCLFVCSPLEAIRYNTLWHMVATAATILSTPTLLLSDTSIFSHQVNFSRTQRITLALIYLNGCQSAYKLYRIWKKNHNNKDRVFVEQFKK